MSFTALAHDQNRHVTSSPTVTSPSGTADLRWDPRNRVITATLHLRGLQPRSNHAAHIHTGSCASMGKILYPFKNAVADAAGNATSVATVKNVTGGISAKGWNVVVHRGSTAQTGDLLCGDVVNSKRTTSVSVPLRAVPAMHQKGA
ncbi:CHRD domain-containing protein [Dictyobacter formicarum]|uniref:CHRD domain-containing protein n=1 Tax=Dictyobacter formicarum TaxID=2778368 RepID=UPI0035712712